MSPPAVLRTRQDLRMVMQDPYKPDIVQKGWIPLPSVAFDVNGVEGIKLTDAMKPRFNGPDGRDELMFTDGHVGNSVSCRIQVRGFYDSNFHY